MARALALGLGRAGDVHRRRLRPRSARSPSWLGGEAVGSNRELAERADVVVLAHKPAQLAAVAQEIDGAARIVVSILATHAPGRGARRLPRRRRCSASSPTRRSSCAAACSPSPCPTRPSTQAARVRGARAVRPPRHRRRRARAADAASPARSAASGPPTGRCSSRPRSTPPCAAACRPRLAATLVGRDDGAASAELLRARDHDTLACAAPSPRRAARPPAASPRSSAPACGPRSPRPWTTSSTPDGRLRLRARRDRRLPRRAAHRLRPDHHRLGHRLVRVQHGRPDPVQPLVERRAGLPARHRRPVAAALPSPAAADRPPGPQSDRGHPRPADRRRDPDRPDRRGREPAAHDARRRRRGGGRGRRRPAHEGDRARPDRARRPRRRARPARPRQRAQLRHRLRLPVRRRRARGGGRRRPR